jgi:hypothetical protein
MRYTIGVAGVAAALIASILAGCGGYGSSSSNTTAATATSTSASASANEVCADISKVQSAADGFKQLDPSTASATQIQQTVSKLGTSVKALSSATAQAAGQAQSDLKSAAHSFRSQLKAAGDQPVAQQLITLGAAIGQLEASLTEATTQLKCNA